MTGILVFGSSLFVLAAACYLLFVTSDPLEQVGGRIGRLLHLPEDVIASTFQALATSGPEIVMAILAATPFVGASVWNTLALGEKACSGCLNMCFSAMDNLLGIGCLGMIFGSSDLTLQRYFSQRHPRGSFRAQRSGAEESLFSRTWGKRDASTGSA